MTSPAWDGSRLAEIRRAQGLTQTDLGDRLGVTQQHISHWERGDRKPGATSLVRLARALEVSVDELLGLEVV